MNDDPAPRWSKARFRWAWLLFKAYRAEDRSEFERGIALLDEANKIRPLKASNRAFRALLLLRAQRMPEARTALANLRKEFQDSSDPDTQYLRRWCTATLGLMTTEPAQFDREARLAQSIPCSGFIKRRFFLPIPDED